MIYRKCTQCHVRVPEYSKCKCEREIRRESLRLYDERRMMDERSKASAIFYKGATWLRCRNSVGNRQYWIDLIEWNKGNIVEVEVFHHIIEVKEDWSLRLDRDNIIGLTQRNHMRVHAMMSKSDKDKALIQDALRELIYKFNKEYYWE